MTCERIAAIRAVRQAAHELANVCAAIVGGTQMAISTATVDTIGKTTCGLAPRPLDAPRMAPRQINEEDV